MKKAKRIGILLLAAVVLCAACFFAGKGFGSAGGNRQMSAVVIENSLAEVSELTTMTYHYTNMAEFESSKDFYGVKLPFTTKSFIITYDGQIKAGIDLSEAKADVSGRRITVTLPEAQILSHEIDEDSIEVFDESTSIFNPLKVEDYKAFSKDQKKTMEAKAEEKGLLEEAHKSAVKNVKEFLGQLAGEDYEIEVK